MRQYLYTMALAELKWYKTTPLCGSIANVVWLLLGLWFPSVMRNVRKHTHNMVHVCEEMPLNVNGCFIHHLDEEELHDECVYIPKIHANRLWVSCFALTVPPVFALYNRLNLLAVISLLVFLTSVNHWRQPRLGIRRNLDILMVFAAVLSHAYVALTCLIFPDSLAYFAFVAATITIYFIGRSYGSKGNHDIGTRVHFFVHIMGVCGNSVLYYQLQSQFGDLSKRQILLL